MQGYYKRKKQLPTFMCVAIALLTTNNFAVMSDVFAFLALKTILIVLDDRLYLFCNTTYIWGDVPPILNVDFTRTKWAEMGCYQIRCPPPVEYRNCVCDDVGESLNKHDGCLPNLRSKPAYCIKCADAFISFSLNKAGQCRSKKAPGLQAVQLLPEVRWSDYIGGTTKWAGQGKHSKKKLQTKCSNNVGSSA